MISNTLRWSAIGVFAVVQIFCVTAEGQIQNSVNLFEVWNYSDSDANDFHVVIKAPGLDLSDLDPAGYYDSDYAVREVEITEDGYIHIYWESGSTPIGESDLFGFTLYGGVEWESCEMFWTRDGQEIAQLDQVWQDWVWDQDQAFDIIRNRSGGRRWIRRTGGLAAEAVNIRDMALWPTPPNPIVIDPPSPASPIAIDPETPLTFGYGAYPEYLTNLMYYELYENIGDPGEPGNLVVRFRNAAVLVPVQNWKADFDNDRDVDGFDFLTFANCYNGSGRFPLPPCENLNADLEGDGDVDGFDFLTFANCYNGSGRTPLSGCP